MDINKYPGIPEEWLEKSFTMLPADAQQQVLKVLGTAEVYDDLHAIHVMARQVATRQVPHLSPLVLSALQQRMPAARSPWWMRPVPAYQVALWLTAVAASIMGLMPRPTPAPLRDTITLIKRDTVYHVQHDTIYQSRTVYRDRVVMVPTPAVASTPVAAPVSDGVSMKDKEELEKLLVSGTD